MTHALDLYLADARCEARAFLADLFKPSPPVDLVGWAGRAINFGADAPFPGPFDIEKFPYWKRPLRCLQPDHPARTVVIKKSAQVGGTVIGDVFVGAYIDMDPSAVLVTHPTIKQGELWLKNKFRAHIRNSKLMRALFPAMGSRDAKSTADYLERSDQRGFIQVGGANSSQSLSQHTVKRQVQDDLSKWENNENGDPEQQADTRDSAYPFDAKRLKISTPTIYGNCRITRGYEEGTQEQLHIRCPNCDHPHPFDWENFRVNVEAAIKNKAADVDKFVAATRGAFFSCPSCGGVIEEHQRDALVKEACDADRWVAGNPGALSGSFYIWSVYSRLKPWSLIAVEWTKAMGLAEKEQVFLNDWVGLAYRVDCETPDWVALRDRAAESGHARGTIPPGYYLLACGIDCQADRVEIGTWAFAPDRRRAVIDHYVLPGSIADQKTKQALSAWLDGTRYRDAYGNLRRVEATAIDAGYETEHVTDWASTRPRETTMAVRGAGSDNAPSIGLADSTRITKRGKRIRKRNVVYWVGQSILKMWLYADLKKTDRFERNSVALAAGFDDGWFVQLASEQRQRTRNKRGFEQPRWVLPSGVRNEVLDVAIYAHAAAEHLLGWKRLTEAQWAVIAAERDCLPQPEQLDLLTADLSQSVRVDDPVSSGAVRRSAPSDDYLGGVSDDYLGVDVDYL